MRLNYEEDPQQVEIDFNWKVNNVTELEYKISLDHQLLEEFLPFFSVFLLFLNTINN